LRQVLLASQHVARCELQRHVYARFSGWRERENVSTPSLDRTDTSTVDATPKVDATSAGARPRRRALLWILIGLLVLAAVGIVVWRAASLEHRPVRRGRNLGTQPVGVTTIKTGDIRLVIDALGTVTPLATVTVQTQINGVLMKVGFKEGQLVHTGDFLAQIDPRPYQVALEQYQGQLERDRAALKQAQMDLTRYQGLQHLDAIARQTAEDQVWVVQQDAGTVALDEAQVKAQRLNLVYCHITAPVDGRVGLRLVDPGNYVQTSSTTGIAMVTQLDPISVIFTVPEDQVPDIVSRFQGNKTLLATAFDRANATQLATGHLGSFDTEVDTTTGTVKMRALFENGTNKLFPYQFVNIRLTLDTLHGVVTVPTAAVQHGAPGDFVYVVDSENTVAVRKVVLGAQDGDSLAVNSGLAAGERVVTDGLDQLKDGNHVTVRNDSAAGAPGAPPARQHRRGNSTADPQAGDGDSSTQGQHLHRRPQQQDSNGTPPPST
jgi:membrane fusion protein, multidrug efflux system